MPNRNNNKFGSNHNYLNSQAATQALALSLPRDGQGFFILKNEGATMKHISSKLIHSRDSKLYDDATDQFATLKTVSVLAAVILSILMAYQVNNAFWKDFTYVMPLMKLPLPY